MPPVHQGRPPTPVRPCRFPTSRGLDSSPSRPRRQAQIERDGGELQEPLAASDGGRDAESRLIQRRPRHLGRAQVVTSPSRLTALTCPPRCRSALSVRHTILRGSMCVRPLLDDPGDEECGEFVVGRGIGMSVPRHHERHMILSGELAEKIERRNAQLTAPAGDRVVDRAPGIPLVKVLRDVGQDQDRERNSRSGREIADVANRLPGISPLM